MRRGSPEGPGAAAAIAVRTGGGDGRVGEDDRNGPLLGFLAEEHDARVDAGHEGQEDEELPRLARAVGRELLRDRVEAEEEPTRRSSTSVERGCPRWLTTPPED